MTVDLLRRILEPLDGDMDVFFGRVPPGIQEVGMVSVNNYGFFGIPCVILEAADNDEVTRAKPVGNWKRHRDGGCNLWPIF